MRSDQDLYRQLRELTCQQLWEQEIPDFNRAGARERLQQLGDGERRDAAADLVFRFMQALDMDGSSGGSEDEDKAL